MPHGGFSQLPQTQQRSRSQARTIGIASAIWAASIFLSRIMGLVREQIIGRTLGASRQADLYFASFTLPDFLNYLLAAGALSIVFIPIFLEHLERGDHKRSWEAFSVIANFILLVGSVGIALLMVFARPLASVVAPGFTSSAEVDTLVRLTRIILPAQFFFVIGGLLSAVLQAKDLLSRHWRHSCTRHASSQADWSGHTTPDWKQTDLRGAC
jgi:putative peptidoglycan lipid II flippase